MTDLRQAAEQALEVLTAFEKIFSPEHLHIYETIKIPEAVRALRQALAEPPKSTTDVVEPIEVAVIGNWGKVEWREGVFPQIGDKMYSAPPKREWVGLTGHEIVTLSMEFIGQFHPADFARAVEVKLKEKNHGNG